MNADWFLRRASACLLLLAAGAAHAASALFISSSPIQPGKFRLLAEHAAAHGVRVEARFIEKLPPDVDAGLFRGHDFVFFDTPRDHLRDAVQARLAPALQALKTPSLWLHDGQPSWNGLPDALAKRLHAYYMNGSKTNFTGFFQTLAAHHAGRSWSGIAPPVVFPKTAIYHPAAPGLVFADTAGYLAWKKVDATGTGKPPVIAIALHQQYIAAEQTAFINDLIARIEAAGAVPLAFYSPVMDADAMRRIMAPGGRQLAEVLINTQIMLNPEGRRKEFEAMGVPVIQAMPYRKGDAAAWAADPQGVALMDVPFYLAQAEYAGVADIQIAAATDKQSDQIAPIAAQSAAVVAKALNMARLQKKPHAEKKIAVLFWNYPPGEKNLGASYMNLPRSLEGTLAALKNAGYRVDSAGEKELTQLLQRLLAPVYRPPTDNRELDLLLQDGLAELFPVSSYRQWLDSLPPAVKDALMKDWGEPEKSAMAVRRNGQAYFAIPRLKLGNAIVMPQAPRGERGQDKEKALYHSSTAAPPHFYLATYLWIRQQFGADALIHYGTHGTQEWLPGKERGLSVYDYPLLAIGDLPVIYPYIVDNIGEATQAKRRGRAVTITYQTPPFAPAGLHEALTKIHDLLHAWLAQDEGAVKEKQKAEFLQLVKKERIDKDLAWSDARIEQDFRGFIDTVHDHLHELARSAQPMGLHTFGKGADEQWRLGTVLLMLGKNFIEAAAGPDEEADEALVGDYAKLVESSPYKLLKRHVVDGVPSAGLTPKLKEAVDRGRRWYADLAAGGEMTGLLAALDGRYVPTSYGGDPIKNPDSLPTGRNLYGFDPSRIPTKAAWEAGKEAMENLIAAHRKQSGRAPKKLTFSLWSVETMRHQGLLEAQALWGLGVEPVWDAGGRVVDVRLVPREQLKRARVDIVLSATGLYRDHFPNVMKQLARAAQLAAEAGVANAESDNPVAANARAISASLVKQGWSKDAARKAGQTRIFSAASGRYGTGLDDAALATDTWASKAEGDRKLAQLYLSRMQFAYGPDEADWGKSAQELSGGKAGKEANLYSAHLKGTEGAVLSRSSNLYGMLTTDDPFQYLGGIALAVRHLDGTAPELYISNLRGTGSGKVEGAAQFLAKELATRNFHPGYIKGLMAEGYAGTLEVLDSMNNFSGWTMVAREIVRDDQWQEFADVYVRDKHRLGLRQWFERENPHALAQTIERMLEAARHGYWQADPATLEELKQTYRDLARRHEVRSDNAKFESFVGMQGFGLGAAQLPKAPAPTPATQGASAAPKPTAPPQITGMKLEQVPPQVIQALGALLIAAIALLVLFPLAGALRQWRKGASA
ncbi:cobaltochelatase subunit CobN [Sulfuritalea sp.]|uniref:cobaltochelatase subunit CobN n=1 Tax=Sulfuritalea sp. TaxID=2480090 RepID=UPI00286E69F1|nr:cobaltochelatase subunit CobN [Sulfuritalea sp.]